MAMIMAVTHLKEVGGEVEVETKQDEDTTEQEDEEVKKGQEDKNQEDPDLEKMTEVRNCQTGTLGLDMYISRGYPPLLPQEYEGS